MKEAHIQPTSSFMCIYLSIKALLLGKLVEMFQECVLKNFNSNYRLLYASSLLPFLRGNTPFNAFSFFPRKCNSFFPLEKRPRGPSTSSILPFRSFFLTVFANCLGNDILIHAVFTSSSLSLFLRFSLAPFLVFLQHFFCCEFLTNAAMLR